MNQDIEIQLQEMFERHLKYAGRSTPPNLYEAMQYSLLAPGKRIRPRLLLAASKLVGLSAHAVLPAALALEMIHCFTLIHDDLPCMDNDDYRRGRLSNHKVFGEKLALLAGDALIPLAIEVFMESQVDPNHLRSGLKQLLWAVGPQGVVGGQAAECLLGKDSSLADLKQMHSQKTGALFSAALFIPKEFAGISDQGPLGESLISFAQALGMAFQTADDLDDAEPTSPTNILFYASAQEASKVAFTSLTSASRRLLNEWGDQSLGLNRIADEVLDQFKKYQNSHL